MLRDPIVDEVRRTRKAIMAQCDNDPLKYVEHLRRVQAECGARVVSFKTKPARKLRKAS